MLALAFTAFWVIFLAELGDKTLFMVLLLSSRHPPLKVFVGAAAAFALHGLIAVALGQVLAGLPHAAVKYGAAALFFVFGVFLLVRSGDSRDQESQKGSGRGPIWSAFLLIFVAEWGDMTQILSAAMVADGSRQLGRLPAALSVFGGAVLGLWLGTAIAAFIGHKASRWLPERVVRRVAGVCFLAVAVYTAFSHA